jgi:hypothetical protein
MGPAIPAGDQILAQQVGPSVSVLQISGGRPEGDVHDKYVGGRASSVPQADADQRWLCQ